MFFTVFITFVIIQRIIEVIIAKRNERWSKEHGAVEFGTEHYKYIVALHTLFFVSLIIEYQLKPELINGWQIFLLVFICAQLLRYWSLFSLGKLWNTKILVIPNTPPVTKGPYRLMKHPNYLVVTLEILVIPIMFGAYVTVIIFSLLNFFLLFFYRIPQEEAALKFLRLPNEK